MSTNRKILLVDDEPNLLQGIRRQLRGKYEVTFAEGGPAGLRFAQELGPYAVVVSDMQMPELDGLALLRHIRELHPESIRVMLTGNADQQTAVDAVNEGQIFRFLNKPCPVERLVSVFDLALEQYRLVTAEQELLNSTLQGAVRLVTDVLGMTRPEAFGTSQSARRLAREIATRMNVGPLWTIELAAMLAYIGAISVPDELFADYMRSKPLSIEQMKLVNEHPRNGFALLNNIPRLQPVAELVLQQLEPPHDGVPTGSRILRVINEFQRILLRESVPFALSHLQSLPTLYDPAVVEALAASLAKSTIVKEVELNELREGMILAKQVETLNGDVLLAAEQEINEVVIQRLRTFSRGTRGVRTPLTVRIHSV